MSALKCSLHLIIENSSRERERESLPPRHRLPLWLSSGGKWLAAFWSNWLILSKAITKKKLLGRLCTIMIVGATAQLKDFLPNAASPEHNSIPPMSDFPRQSRVGAGALHNGVILGWTTGEIPLVYCLQGVGRGGGFLTADSTETCSFSAVSKTYLQCLLIHCCCSLACFMSSIIGILAVKTCQRGFIVGKILAALRNLHGDIFRLCWK